MKLQKSSTYFCKFDIIQVILLGVGPISRYFSNSRLPINEDT